MAAVAITMAELGAVELEEDNYRIMCDAMRGGSFAPLFSDRVDYCDKLNKPVVNLRAFEGLRDIAKCRDDTTRWISVSPGSPRVEETGW